MLSLRSGDLGARRPLHLSCTWQSGLVMRAVCPAKCVAVSSRACDCQLQLYCICFTSRGKAHADGGMRVQNAVLTALLCTSCRHVMLSQLTV
jgi:hypothetical protein